MDKMCKQCGEIKSEDQFRKYYGGRNGTYKTCKACEKINSREKYLSGKPTHTASEQEELDKIHKLWEYQITLGLKPPGAVRGKGPTVAENISIMLEHYCAQATAVATNMPAQAANVPPYELVKWLVEPLTEDPEYYQETVYEDLKKKYRQQIGFDTQTDLPIFDDTYREILQTILARFDVYEDAYYKKN